MIYCFLLIHSKYVQMFKHYSSIYAHFSPFTTNNVTLLLIMMSF